jgi:predicted Zn-dependent protease
VTVGGNDTVEKLAQRMAVSDHKLERFRVINGLSATDRLKPGEKAKMVVE